ncbi:MAG: class I SAM-dependent methyltransferase [Anaerolineae bacterium]|nr:class I SAM-dependent methyltransferase [Anaerolineae bacterium]
MQQDFGRKMTFYNDPENAQQYIEMAAGYDGAKLIAILREYLPDGATVLELGMGPGVDLKLLSKHFTVTGSDYARPFLERYREIDPSADLLQLDAITLDTDRTFDAIYSNKVLQHLTRDELRQSLARQLKLLNDGGIALHAFWYGDKPDELMHGLRFVYYTEETLRVQIDTQFELLRSERFAEMEDGDSLFVVLRKRQR